MVQPAVNIVSTFYTKGRGLWTENFLNGKLYSRTSETWPWGTDNCLHQVINRKPATINTLPWTPYKPMPVTNWYRESKVVHTPSVLAKDVQSYPPWVYVNHRGHTAGLSAMPSFDESLSSKVTNELLNSFKEEGEASLGLALLERKQTEKLLISTLERVASGVRAYRKARKGDWKGVLRAFGLEKDYKARGLPGLRQTALGKIPQSWLELQYGWKPLMMDLHSAMSAVDYHQRQNDYWFSKEASGKSDAARLFTVYSHQGIVGDYLVARGTARSKCKVAVTYYLKTNTLPLLASLGLTNPASLVWETVPFSFVIDWFLPLGSWFNTFDATLGKQFVSGYRTQSVKVPQVTFAWNPGGAPGYTFEAMGGLNLLRYFSLTRTKLVSFPSPSFPALKNPCSPGHVANALSLLVGVFGKSTPRNLRI